MSASPQATAEPRKKPRVWLLLPHEHGAWFMLFSPVAIGLAAAQSARALPVVLLVLTLTAAYLARNAADMALRPRQRAIAMPWLWGYGALGAASGLGLIAFTHSWQIVAVGAAAGALYLVHRALRRTRARLDRTVWGELVGVGALCLGAPAAVAIGGGRLDAHTWALWAVCWLFFGSSVFHVRGMLEAAKVRGAFGRSERWRAARPGIAYHLAATVALAGASVAIPPGLVLVAVAPAYVRAAVGLARLSNRLPRLALVGAGESACTIWFTVVLSLGLH